ncbi:MAG TPA: hypothetical protein PLQ68_07850 [Clostridia bacterium]|nr:hypothetical protein [Clostridia bacterium]
MQVLAAGKDKTSYAVSLAFALTSGGAFSLSSITWKLYSASDALIRTATITPVTNPQIILLTPADMSYLNYGNHRTLIVTAIYTSGAGENLTQNAEIKFPVEDTPGIT